MMFNSVMIAQGSYFLLVQSIIVAKESYLNYVIFYKDLSDGKNIVMMMNEVCSS